MRPELSQTQSLVQRQELIPAQIQSLEILQATIPELEQKISEALAENPTLELLSSGREELAGNPTEEDAREPVAAAGAEEPHEREAAAEGDAGAAAEVDSPATEGADTPDWLDTAEGAAPAGDEWGALEEAWREYLPPASTGQGPRSEEEEERRQYRFDSLVQTTSLQEILLAQFRQQAPADPRTIQLGQEIIGSIDESGYLRSHPADIAIACEAELDEVHRVLRLVQQLDPPGVGARDLRECLLLQLERQGRKNSLEYEIVRQYLDELGRNQIPRVARKMRLSPSRIYEALREIRRLAPYPGSRIDTGETPTTFIIPEVTIARDDKGKWQVESNRESRPRLRLSPYYLRLLRDPETPPEARAYLRAKLGESKLLLRALDNRQSTIERIAWALLERQRGFFEAGPEALQPLTLTQVAADLHLHETTISRAIAGKYARTPHGLFAFKQFFSSGGGITDAGDKVTDATVKQKLAEIVRAEDPARPLSDQQIMQALAAQGIRLARRTVAKYREEMNVLPSHLRRRFATD